MAELETILNLALDLSFFDLYGDKNQDKVGVLEELLNNYFINPVHQAVGLYICDKHELYLLAYPGETTGKRELRRRYLKERLPQIAEMKKETISEYRQAGQVVFTHKDIFEKIGVNPADEKCIKKLVAAFRLIKNGSDPELVLTELFPGDAPSEASTNEEKRSAKVKCESSLERYVTRHEHYRNLFQLH